MAIRSLRDADASCGAKAHSLARLLAAGLPVPDGFALDTQVFRDLAAMHDDDLVGGGAEGAPDGIGHALEAAAQRISTVAIRCARP